MLNKTLYEKRLYLYLGVTQISAVLQTFCGIRGAQCSIKLGNGEGVLLNTVLFFSNEHEKIKNIWRRGLIRTTVSVPSSELEPTQSRNECVPPPNQRGRGAHSPTGTGEGGGWVPIWTTGEKA